MFIVVLSSALLVVAHLFNMLLQPCEEACYTELAPLILVGIGYSIYAAALWGSIPYVVEPRTVGTAFGFCTAIQNAGMAIAPTVGASIKDATLSNMFGYYWLSFFWVVLAAIGCLLNCWLYFEDINHNGGILNKVHKGDQIQDLMTSPKPEERRKIEQDPEISDAAKGYLLDKNNRSALKRSMAQAHK